MAKRRTVFPFSAIVGQEKMKRALILNAVNPMIGGVLIRGERGTAKSTASRALASLLPSIDVVIGTRFNLAEGESVEEEDLDSSKTELRPTPFVDLPVSATEDRVVGTVTAGYSVENSNVDVAKATLQGSGISATVQDLNLMLKKPNGFNINI